MKFKAKITLCLVGVLLLCTLMISTRGSANVRSGSINGTITYDGSEDSDHEVLVSAHLSLQEGPEATVPIQGPGPYCLDGLADGDYYISAFLNLYEKPDGPPDNGEPFGWYDSNDDGSPDKVTVSGNSLNDIDILMEDITENFIKGTACYLGGVYGDNGILEVGLYEIMDQEPLTIQFINLPCDDYTFSGGPSGTYYVGLFYDVNGSRNAPEPGEPVGYYDANGDGVPDPVVYEVGDAINGIDITLGGIHYVDFSADGAADGSSWDDAFTDLGAALDVAEPGQEIWVASGIYKPGTARTDSFLLQEGVAVYGGFNGTEDYRFQRNLGANTTILSGEIGDPNLVTDNVYHVVTADSTTENPIDESTILDGFTITGGYAYPFGSADKGGGLINTSGNPTLVNLNFIDNSAESHGGAIVTQYNSEPLIVSNCTFSGNDTESNGAIANISGNLAVVNSSLIGNFGANGGGIVTLGTNPHTEIHNTILWNNAVGQIGTQGGTTVVSYSIVQGGYLDGTSIINQDPQFIDANGADDIYGTLDDDLHLQATSPAINAGSNDLVPEDIADSNGNGNISEKIPFDFEGDLRLVDAVDIGADEFTNLQEITGLQFATSPSMLAGQAIQFAARAESGTHIDYSWDFGDGNQEDGPHPTHVYPNSGVYTIVLTAENSLYSQEISVDIEVSQSFGVGPGTSKETDDGALRIEVPSSAAEAVDFIYTPQSIPTPTIGSLQFAGRSFQLSAFDSGGNPIIYPDQPFILTITYDESDLPEGTAEADLQLYRYDSDSGDWIALEVIERNPEENQLTVSLDHFSEFALLAAVPEEPLVNLYLPLIVR